MTRKMMKHWLFKSEPDVFSFEDLCKAPDKTTCWEGVRNYQARNFLRDQIKKGDRVLFYHSNIKEPAIMGTAQVVREAYPDSFAMDPKSRYFDPEALKKGKNPWVMVDIQALNKFMQPVTREALMKVPKLKNMMVLKKGIRLSIQPISPEEFEIIEKLGKAVPI